MDAFYQINMNERWQMQVLDNSIYMKFEKQGRKTSLKDACVDRWWNYKEKQDVSVKFITVALGRWDKQAFGRPNYGQ